MPGPFPLQDKVALHTADEEKRRLFTALVNAGPEKSIGVRIEMRSALYTPLLRLTNEICNEVALAIYDQTQTRR